MRTPTAITDAYRWHQQALRDLADGLEVSADSEPQCGWFKRRLVKGGPWVPARIWLYSPTNDEGELDGDELLQCEVDGEWADAHHQWLWLFARPISEAEFRYLTARISHAKSYEPDDPVASPRRRVDWMKVPLPEFNRRNN